MGLADLMTLAEVEAMRRGKPLFKGTSRLDAKTAADTDDAKQLEIWKRAVRTRDKHHCRVCGCKTKVTLELDPRRAECHHIVSRADKAVRYDVRNGVLTCLKCHRRFKARTLFVIGKASEMFTVNGVSYLNGDCLTLQFKEKA